jgi:hypothetical protein
MKEIIGGLLNMLDAGTERDLIVAKLVSCCHLPFNLNRYKNLIVHDFSDNLTTVDVNELFGPGANGGQPLPEGPAAVENQAQMQAQLDRLIQANL